MRCENPATGQLNAALLALSTKCLRSIDWLPWTKAKWPSSLMVKWPCPHRLMAYSSSASLLDQAFGGLVSTWRRSARL